MTRGVEVPRWVEPVGYPFPCVAGDAVEAVGVGREGVGGAGGGVGVFCGVGCRTDALPNVA